jgi:hypothetical protein
MPVWDPDDALSHPADFRLVSNAFVSMFFSEAVLDPTLAWLVSHDHDVRTAETSTPDLRVKKMQGPLRTVWEARVDRANRITFLMDGDTIALLHNSIIRFSAGRAAGPCISGW